MPDGVEKVSIAWHPAFCSVAEYDLRTEIDNLQFDSEYNLSREPLRIDLLIIKKNKDEQSNNDIARLFRKYNVIEYKSPDDGLTIDDFYKTIGYACLYKSSGKIVNEIPANELTVSLFRESYPEKLIQTLFDDGASIVKTAPGVYEIKSSMIFPAQIVVTKELDNEKHASYKMLSRNVRTEDIELFLNEVKNAKTPWERANIDAILQVCVSANRVTFEEMKRRDPSVCEALRDLMKEEIREEINEKDRNNAINLYKNGVKVDIIAASLDVALDVVMKWLGLKMA